MPANWIKCLQKSAFQILIRPRNNEKKESSSEMSIAKFPPVLSWSLILLFLVLSLLLLIFVRTEIGQVPPIWLMTGEFLPSRYGRQVSFFHRPNPSHKLLQVEEQDSREWSLSVGKKDLINDKLKFSYPRGYWEMNLNILRSYQ